MEEPYDFPDLEGFTDIPSSEIFEEVHNSPLMKRLPLDVYYIMLGYQSENSSCCEKYFIVTFQDLIPRQLGNLLKTFNDYFGPPIKHCNEPVVPGITVPDRYIPILNNMHGITLGALLTRRKEYCLEQLVEKLDASQGASTDPPINLGNKQVLYAKSSGDKVELARICPWRVVDTCTVEYLIYRKETAQMTLEFS